MVKTTADVKLVLLHGMFTNCNSFSKMERIQLNDDNEIEVSVFFECDINTIFLSVIN